MILIDSDIFAIDLIYQRDERYSINKEFLHKTREATKATTIFNLMEIIGKLSFIKSSSQLIRFYQIFPISYNLIVLLPETSGLTAKKFLEGLINTAFIKMCTKMGFLDALILNVAEGYPEVKTFITWNARHFHGKTILEVMTPLQYIELKTQ